MSVCYYCGRTAEYVCDFIENGKFCGRAICGVHAVPEFEGGETWAWTLCKDHAMHQVKAA